MSLTKVSYSMIAGAIASILDYGANTSLANNATAINAAIAALPANSTLYFPPGIYKITAAINVNKRINIVGAGSYTTIIQNEGVTDAIIISGAYWQGVSGIQVTGNALSGDGIVLSTFASYIQVVDVKSNGNGGNGLVVTPDNYGITIDRCFFNNNTLSGISAIAVAGTGQINALHISNTECKSNTVNGLEISGSNLTIKNNIFESNGASGIKLDTITSDCDTVTISGNYFEANVLDQLHLVCHPDVGFTISALTIGGNYFNNGVTPFTNGAQIYATTTTTGAGIEDLQLLPTNRFYTESSANAANLNNALAEGDGQSRIYSYLGLSGANAATWASQYVNIGYGAIIPYIKTLGLSGYLLSKGTISYPSTAPSNIAGSAWPVSSTFPILLPTGAVPINAGIAIFTDSSNWSVKFEILACDMSVATAGAVIFTQTLNYPTGAGGGMFNTSAFASLVDINTLRIDPSSIYYLVITLNDIGIGVGFTVNSPFIRYME